MNLKMLKPFDDTLNFTDIKKLNLNKNILAKQSRHYLRKLKSGHDGELTVFGIHKNKHKVKVKISF